MRNVSEDAAMAPPTRWKVLVVDPIHDEALERLRRTCDVVVRLRPSADEIVTLSRDADVIVLRSGVQLSAELFAGAQRLKLVARAGAGTDNIDLTAARHAGVVVFNVPGESAGAVAELTIGLLLALARKISLADRQARTNIWNKSALVGSELAGKTMGIVGHGNIGARVAHLAQGFSMRVLTCVEREDEPRRRALAAKNIKLVGFPAMLRESDVVCLVVPLTPRTRGLISEPELAMMKCGAYLVNVSRGEIVDEPALHEALKQGTIAGAALDVRTDEGSPTQLSTLDNVVLTPHIGAMSSDAQRRIGHIVVESIHSAMTGAPVDNRVC